MLKYEVDVKKFSELKEKIDIPKFQRGLVWGKPKKREFIKTLKEGLPIGMLLLAPRGDRYLIIDGLQRFTTMKEYSRNFFSYIDKSEITDFDLMAIILASSDARKNYDEYIESAKKSTLEEMRSIIAERIGQSQNKNHFDISKEIALELCKKIAILPNEDCYNIQGEIFKIIEKIYNQAKIDDITVPIIIFRGADDELASIFQKLNQEGVKLSKYDVFAATWIKNTVVVKNDPKFIECITNKYEAAEVNSDLEIAGFDPEEMKQSGELTVFEYSFALGKALMEACPVLFPKLDEAKVDSIGFLILAELMGLSYQKMGQLGARVALYKSLDFKQLKDSIIEAGRIVETSLGRFIESPSGKGTKRISLACHSELQVASYIIVIFKLMYSLTPEEGLKKNLQSKELQRVKRYLRTHYIYDIIRGYWTGSGDTKLEEIIADPPICRYVKDVDKNEFEQEVSRWMNESNQKIKSVNVAAETKLFLNYLFRGRVGATDSGSYDIEHCVPKDVVKKYYHKKDIMVPMSSVCNLTYIPVFDNRSKGEETYYQRQSKNTGAYELNAQQLERLLYPTREELRFVESVKTLTEENYMRFLKERRNTLLNAIMTVLFPE